MSLYNKYRPLTWDSVVGQDGIVETLRNAVGTNQVVSTYIFQGPRGTGKTTCARILAKALNCESPAAPGVPCGKCAACDEIAKDTSTNVIEIDAASNTGVDHMREVKQSANMAVSEGWKVYIIDECHMLSKSAQNSALKLFEESPPKTIFILATTELNKVEGTIISRSLRFDFRPVTIDSIIKRLQFIIQAEGIEADVPSLNMIAKAANGGMRDSISILERVSIENSKKLSVDSVVRSLGITPTEIMIRLGEVVQGNHKVGFEIVSGVVERGYDIFQFLQGAVDYFRDLMMIKMGLESSVLVDTETMQSLKQISSSVTFTSCTSSIKSLEEAMSKYRFTDNKRVLVELALYKIADIPSGVHNTEGQMLEVAKAPTAPVVPGSDHQPSTVDPQAISQMVGQILQGIDFSQYIPQGQPAPTQSSGVPIAPYVGEIPTLENNPMKLERPRTSQLSEDEWEQYKVIMEAVDAGIVRVLGIGKMLPFDGNTLPIEYDPFYKFYADDFNAHYAVICAKKLSELMHCNMLVKAIVGAPTNPDTVDSVPMSHSPKENLSSGQMVGINSPQQKSELSPINIGGDGQNGNMMNNVAPQAQPTQSVMEQPQPQVAPQPVPQAQAPAHPQPEVSTGYQQPGVTQSPISPNDVVDEDMLTSKFGYGGK